MGDSNPCSGLFHLEIVESFHSRDGICCSVCRFDRIERLKKLVVVVGAVETVEKSEKWRICRFFFQQCNCWMRVEKLNPYYSFWKVERLWSWKEKLVENFVENSRKIERQKFFKNPHVETVETENRIFHKLWKTLLKVFGKSVENRKNGLKSAHFFRWNQHIFREKTGFTDTIRLHIVEYAAVFSKPEIGNLFA